MSHPARFSELLERFSPEVQQLALAARSLILELDPEAVEVVWVRQGTAGYGVGPRKMSEHYAYLALHPRHVNLGFYRGAALPDPDHVLGGPGAMLRHTRLTAPDDIARPALRDLLVAARKERVAALAS